MPEWRRKERTFTIAPVPSDEASEQTLVTVPCWAEVKEVRYVPNGRLVLWNDEKVHLGRCVSLNLRNSGSGAAPARQVMVAWEEEARNPSVVEDHDEFRMPVVVEGKTSELHKGDELYWQSRPIAEGDTGDPGGTLRVTFMMSLPKVEFGKAAAEVPNWAVRRRNLRHDPLRGAGEVGQARAGQPAAVRGQEFQHLLRGEAGRERLRVGPRDARGLRDY